MVVQRAVSLDEQKFVEVQERIRKRDSTAQLAGFVEQFAASRRISQVGVLDCLLEPGQFPCEARQVRLWLELQQVVIERSRAANHNVGRIAVLVQYQRIAAKSGCGDLGRRGSVGQLTGQDAILGIPLRRRLGCRRSDHKVCRKSQQADDRSGEHDPASG